MNYRAIRYRLIFVVIIAFFCFGLFQIRELIILEQIKVQFELTDLQTSIIRGGVLFLIFIVSTILVSLTTSNVWSYVFRRKKLRDKLMKKYSIEYESQIPLNKFKEDLQET